MSVDFKKKLSELRSLILTLQDRCSNAERRSAELKELVDEQERQLKILRAEKEELESNYRDLQVGMAMGRSEQDIEKLKMRFLGMVHEIDDCIDKLKG